jgi:lysozyme
MHRDLSPAVTLIKSFEGIEDGDPTTVNLDPYLCPAGYWTIGWGHVVLDADGTQVRGAGNRRKARSIYPHGITMAEAEALLADDIRPRRAAIERLLKVPLSDNQFCALLDLAYNIGLGDFAHSTLLRDVNNGAFSKVPAQFMRWTKAKGREMAGLKRRREAEVALWQTL